jgi:hypothetical protein
MCGNMESEVSMAEFRANVLELLELLESGSIDFATFTSLLEQEVVFVRTYILHE